MSARGIAPCYNSTTQTVQPCKGDTSVLCGQPLMSQSLANNSIHLVFSTKERRPFLSEAIRPRLYAYLNGIFESWQSPAITIGGHADHVHALFLLSKNHPLSKVVEEVKKSSSKWLKSINPYLDKFSWQSGYSAFSVSESNISRVVDYIRSQDEHHRRITFQDELRRLLKRHGFVVDEVHLWS